MRRKLLPLAITMVLACVTAATSLAAGSTQVTQFSFTTPPHDLCGILGTAVVLGVFTAADSGKSTTLVGAGPVKQTAPPVIDEQAGTVTIATTYGGLYEKFSITGGPTLSINAGAATFVDVFEYTGDPNNPVGDLISETLSRLDGPHPDLASGGCEVLVPYLQGP
jgi:hypothetical protein